MAKKLISAFIFLIIFSMPVYPWWSSPLTDKTHTYIGQDAMTLILGDFEDIYKFRKDILSGCGEEAHNKANSTDIDSSLNGGDVSVWWKEALSQYKKFEFQEAYTTIGKICHLIQDQAVPTHAADILHGFGTKNLVDKFEHKTSSFYKSGIKGKQVILGSRDINAYYDKLLNNTLTQIDSHKWKHPDTGEDYWIRGSYGGKNNTDIFDGDKNIITSQLKEAIGYTAGALMEASQMLPPLIKDLKIAGSPLDAPVIDTIGGNDISFEILENRKKEVDVFITVDSKDGPAIIDDAYGKGKTEKLEKGNDLPWEKKCAFTWNGKLANGDYPSVGEHTLYVWAYDKEDKDNNYSEEEKHKFLILGLIKGSKTGKARDEIFKSAIEEKIEYFIHLKEFKIAGIQYDEQGKILWDKPFLGQGKAEIEITKCEYNFHTAPSVTTGGVFSGKDSMIGDFSVPYTISSGSGPQRTITIEPKRLECSIAIFFNKGKAEVSIIDDIFINRHSQTNSEGVVFKDTSKIPLREFLFGREKEVLEAKCNTDKPFLEISADYELSEYREGLQWNDTIEAQGAVSPEMTGASGEDLIGEYINERMKELLEPKHFIGNGTIKGELIPNRKYFYPDTDRKIIVKACRYSLALSNLKIDKRAFDENNNLAVSIPGSVSVSFSDPVAKIIAVSKDHGDDRHTNELQFKPIAKKNNMLIGHDKIVRVSEIFKKLASGNYNIDYDTMTNLSESQGYTWSLIVMKENGPNPFTFEYSHRQYEENGGEITGDLTAELSAFVQPFAQVQADYNKERKEFVISNPSMSTNMMAIFGHADEDLFIRKNSGVIKVTMQSTWDMMSEQERQGVLNKYGFSDEEKGKLVSMNSASLADYFCE